MSKADNQSLTQHLLDTFTTALAELPVFVEGMTDEPDENATYVRFVVRPDDVEAVTIGANRTYEQFGQAILQVLQPQNLILDDDDKDAYEIADIYINAFRDWRSPDKAITVFRCSQQWIPNKQFTQINVTAFWVSKRR